MKHTNLSIFALTSTALFSLAALGAETEGTSTLASSASSSRVLAGNSPSVGVFGGYSELPAGEAGGLIGAELGYKPTGGVQVGVSGGFAGITQDYKRTTVLGKAAVSFGGDVPILRTMYFGATGGWVKDTVDLIGDLSVSDDYWAVGPVIGFDEPIDRSWTIGAEARYLANFEDRDIENSFSVAGALKYWY